MESELPSGIRDRALGAIRIARGSENSDTMSRCSGADEYRGFGKRQAGRVFDDSGEGRPFDRGLGHKDGNDERLEHGESS